MHIKCLKYFIRFILQCLYDLFGSFSLFFTWTIEGQQRERHLSDFIQHILICVSKSNQSFYGFGNIYLFLVKIFLSNLGLKSLQKAKRSVLCTQGSLGAITKLHFAQNHNTVHLCISIQEYFEFCVKMLINAFTKHQLFS